MKQVKSRAQRATVPLHTRVRTAEGAEPVDLVAWVDRYVHAILRSEALPVPLRRATTEAA